MTKYTTAASRRRVGEPEHETPAIWRGVGCLMIVIIPVISYALALLTVQIAVAQNWPMPYQLLGYPVMPKWLAALPGLNPIVFFVQSQQDLYAVLLIAVVYIVVLGGILSVMYSLVYRYVGPPRYGPLDAPPPKIAVKRYKR